MVCAQVLCSLCWPGGSLLTLLHRRWCGCRSPSVCTLYICQTYRFDRCVIWLPNDQDNNRRAGCMQTKDVAGILPKRSHPAQHANGYWTGLTARARAGFCSFPERYTDRCPAGQLLFTPDRMSEWMDELATYHNGNFIAPNSDSIINYEHIAA